MAVATPGGAKALTSRTSSSALLVEASSSKPPSSSSPRSLLLLEVITSWPPAKLPANLEPTACRTAVPPDLRPRTSMTLTFFHLVPHPRSEAATPPLPLRMQLNLT